MSNTQEEEEEECEEEDEEGWEVSVGAADTQREVAAIQRKFPKWEDEIWGFQGFEIFEEDGLKCFPPAKDIKS